MQNWQVPFLCLPSSLTSSSTFFWQSHVDMLKNLAQQSQPLSYQWRREHEETLINSEVRRCLEESKESHFVKRHKHGNIVKKSFCIRCVSKIQVLSCLRIHPHTEFNRRHHTCLAVTLSLSYVLNPTPCAV